MAHCANPWNATASASREFCCATNNFARAGANKKLEFCLYLTSSLGAAKIGSRAALDAARPVNGWAYVKRAKACEFGYCADGDAFLSTPSPPPPPPWDMPPQPPRPAMPGKPETAKDSEDKDVFTTVRRCRLNTSG